MVHPLQSPSTCKSPTGTTHALHKLSSISAPNANLMSARCRLRVWVSFENGCAGMLYWSFH